MTKKESVNKIDRLYSKDTPELRPFTFNQAVVDVFPDMINRSVPGYQTIVDGIGRIAARVLDTHDKVYDLGCSLGSVSLSIAKHVQGKAVHIQAIDNSEAMIERCKLHTSAFTFDATIDVEQEDITKIAFTPCKLVVINFTLQFIEQAKRQAIINAIYDALLPGGVLLISEKVRCESSKIDDLLVSLHHDFKRDNGYSDLEISQKRSALENVMILDDIETHQARLKQAGFSDYGVWFRHYNFLSMCAMK